MRMLFDLRFRACLVDMAQVFLNLALDAGFLPGFAARGFFLCGLIGLPAAFW